MGARNIGPTQQQRCRRQPAWPGLLDAAEGDTRGVRRGIEGVVAKRACDSVMIRAEVNIQGSLRQRQAAGGHLLLRVSWCHHAHAAVGPARMKLQALLAGPGPPIGWSIRCRLTINVNVLRLQAPSLEEATEGPEQLLAADEPRLWRRGYWRPRLGHGRDLLLQFPRPHEVGRFRGRLHISFERADARSVRLGSDESYVAIHPSTRVHRWGRGRGSHGNARGLDGPTTPRPNAKLRQWCRDNTMPLQRCLGGGGSWLRPRGRGDEDQAACPR
mmetsp:Transcript_142832/g.355955  ORF Transcript_142832/g.355955 Transcript_142832/m.355955 type:complete len:272 (+) Transcript_142832:183-998(+)